MSKILYDWKPKNLVAKYPGYVVAYCQLDPAGFKAQVEKYLTPYGMYSLKESDLEKECPVEEDEARESTDCSKRPAKGYCPRDRKMV